MDTREQAWAAAMQAGRDGDLVAYRHLLAEIAQRLRPLVQARLRRLGLATSDAEDIVQEVLIGLHAKRHTWDAGSPFLPWLNAIVQHKLIDAARRLRQDGRRRAEVRPEDWGDLPATGAVDLDRTVENVERHIDRLPASQGMVLRALAVEGISVRATAERMRTSEGVVRMTLHRALERIAASLHAPPQAESLQPRSQRAA